MLAGSGRTPEPIATCRETTFEERLRPPGEGWFCFHDAGGGLCTRTAAACERARADAASLSFRRDKQARPPGPCAASQFAECLSAFDIKSGEPSGWCSPVDSHACDQTHDSMDLVGLEDGPPTQSDWSECELWD
jgi:hypothetical protein